MAEGAAGAIAFYTADPRSVLPLNAFHCPRRLKRTLKRFEVRVNTAFDAVIRGCADRQSTWINDTIIEVYTELHQRGFVHSIESWQEDRLCGGLYGVTLGGAFFGESMFTRVPDASKVCVVRLVERLQQRGFVLLDCQQQTRHMARFGARLVPMARYDELLGAALRLKRRFA